MEAKVNKAVSERSANSYSALDVERREQRSKRRRSLKVCCAVTVSVIILLVVVAVTLAFTVFKPKDPKTTLVSAQLDGVSPRLGGPDISFELNVTLALRLRIENRNYASFRHGAAESVLLYRGSRFGSADLFPGNIPARGSVEVPCRLTLQVDELGSDLAGLVSDIITGELAVETGTRIPGRVTFLGIIKRHVVAVSECRFVIGILDLKMRSQDCETKTEL